MVDLSPAIGTARASSLVAYVVSVHYPLSRLTAGLCAVVCTVRYAYRGLHGICANGGSVELSGTGVVKNTKRKTRAAELKTSVTVYRLPIRLPAKSALTWPVV